MDVHLFRSKKIKKSSQQFWCKMILETNTLSLTISNIESYIFVSSRLILLHLREYYLFTYVTDNCIFEFLHKTIDF